MRASACILAVSTLMVACSGSTISPSAPTASVASSPSIALAIEASSDRYGYSLSLPDGWMAKPIGADRWLGEMLPGPEYRGADQYAHPDGYTLSIAAAELDPPITPAEWTTRQLAVVDGQSSCHGEPDRETATVGGEPAEMLVFDRSDCEHDHHAVVVTLVHDSKGYAMTWLAPPGAADARRPHLDAVLSSLAFDA